MKGKLTSQELSDVMMQSVALSTILAEKFEIMTENNLVIHKAKQSLKTTTGFLSNYGYHIINYPEFKIPRDIKAKTHFVESDNKPARLRSNLLKHHNKSNKTSTNYEGTGLNKR
jgi:hypothetical protein